jgi:hypothetical protein
VLAYLGRHHMGFIALFVALGGTSYAAIQLPSNSVGTSQIRAGAVTAAKLHNGAITPAKLSRALNALLRSPRVGAVAYGYYPALQPCVPASGTACPDILIRVGALNPAVNVSLGTPSARARGGVVCLAPGAGIDFSHAVVVTAPTGGPNGSTVIAVDHAEWIPGAPNCAPRQIEVDTYYVTSDGSGQHVTRTELPFAFAIF